MIVRTTFVGCLLSVSATSIQAHHSQASSFDSSRRIEITGEVVEWRFRSPHSLLIVNGVGVIDGVPTGGGTQRWQIESSAAPRLRLSGIDADTFKPGDRVTVKGLPPRNPNVYRASALGSITDAYFDANQAAIGKEPLQTVTTPVTATGIEKLVGLWVPPLQRYGETSPLPLNERGLAAWRGYDEKLSPANTCEPASIPDIFNTPRYIVGVEIGEGYAIVRNQPHNVVRTIPIDGSAAQADPEGIFGTVRGRIDGEAVIVERRDYPPSKWGLAVATQVMGAGADVPSSEQKTVVERFSVSDDGLTLIYEYTVDDPVYLSASFSHRVELARIPSDTPVYPYDCDVEAASELLRE